MRIMKVVDKKIGEKIYYKYRVNLPKEAVEKLKLEDKEVTIKIQGKRIILEQA